MSVINQMLKDLEQRNPEGKEHSAHPQNIATPQSAIKAILITAVTVLAFCLMAFYIWQLNNDNSTLKERNSLKLVAAQLTPEKNSPKSTEGKGVADQKTTSERQAKSSTVETTRTDALKQPAPVVSHIIEAPINKPIPTAKLGFFSQEKVTTAQPLTTKVVVNNSQNKETPAIQKTNAAHSDEHSHSETSSLSHSHNKAQTKVRKANKTIVKAKPKANVMSVSRRQLSADELAAQKLALAEKAIAAKQVTKAEKLLEEVVILTPKDSQTRKKLAALWFGRQAYQDASNLLSQGIALNGKDSSLREMKARIHLKQGQLTLALNTLKPLVKLENVQYQIMLANTAQQANHHESTAQAYRMLIAMQPDMGRWQLGLAVLYDKNSQFDLANEAYKKALTKNDLSVASEQFVQQRIQAIGY
ncbi:MAG: tetratricopeptide repeat protein [Colwellia sp.]|nr:tetratricopeptide repeat protein [Colwellia sp.]